MYYDIGLRPVLPVVVRTRIRERHPEISEEDVRIAWERAHDSIQRPGESIWITLGFDGRGRELEILGDLCQGRWVLFHALTPPTGKILREIEQIRRRAR